MGTWTVYQHVNKTNGKVYIGITCKDPPSERWRGSGQGYNIKYQPKFARAIQKYGWENFQHIILYTGLTHKEAVEKEIQLIREQDSINNGYNTTQGGEGSLGRKCSEQTKQKMRATLGDKTKGKNNHFYGKHHTEATKTKLSQAHKGRPGLKGPLNPAFGTHPVFSKEHKEKIRKTQEKNMKPVVLYDTEHKIVLKEYASVKEAARQEQLDYRRIREETKVAPHAAFRKRIRFILKEDLHLWNK